MPRFDIKKLRDLAGAKAFARGGDYHRDEQVTILSIEPERVLAQVEGSENYRTELAGGGEKIVGKCSCPAYEDWGFCKHMVAVGLAANAEGDGGESGGALSRIRDHLKAKGADSLVEMIVSMAERDLTLFRRLDSAASVGHGDDKTVEQRLRKMINAATRGRADFDYVDDEDDWITGVQEALDPIADLVLAERAGLALKLVNHAIGRIESAADETEGDDGSYEILLDRAFEIHLSAARIARPEPVQLARDLFAREMAASAMSGYAEFYADVLGKKGLAEYRRLAQEAWEKLPPRSRPKRSEVEFSEDYGPLKNILDYFAACDGDVEVRIALRVKDLSSSMTYLELAEFLLSQGRDADALDRAEEGLWMFDDGYVDERLLLFTVDLMSKTGRNAEAEGHLWRTFEKLPRFDLYQRLRLLEGDAARDRAIAFLEPRLANTERIRKAGFAEVEVFIHILMHEQMLDAAWTAARKHEVSWRLKESLAEMSEQTHPREVLETYAGRVDELVQSGSNPGYEEAAKLVARMAAVRDAAEQLAYVTAIKARYRAKRNFMKLLG